MQRSLLHAKIVILIGDPWELGEALKWQALPGEIVQVKESAGNVEALLIRLHNPFTVRDVDCEYFVAQQSVENEPLAKLLGVSKVDSALTRIATDRAESVDPFDLSWWRGGVTIRGNLELA